MNKIIHKAPSWSNSGSIFYGRMDGKSSLNIPKIVRYLTSSKIFKRRFTEYTDYLIKISK